MDEVAEEDEEMAEFPKDSEGTAKVALIAMDRSIGAWGQLLRTFPERETPTLELLVYLDRLRRAAGNRDTSWKCGTEAAIATASSSSKTIAEYVKSSRRSTSGCSRPIQPACFSPRRTSAV